MRKNWLAAGVMVTLAASVMAAEIDFSDFDDSLMRVDGRCDQGARLQCRRSGCQGVAGQCRRAGRRACVGREIFRSQARGATRRRLRARRQGASRRGGAGHRSAEISTPRRMACARWSRPARPATKPTSHPNEIGILARRVVRCLRRRCWRRCRCGVAAQNIFDFDDWMQRIDDGSQDLQRHIAARDPPAASGAAREIEELYGLMEKFFEKRGNADDAVRWSREGREFAHTRAGGPRGAPVRFGAPQCARHCAWLSRLPFQLQTICKLVITGATCLALLYMQVWQLSRWTDSRVGTRRPAKPDRTLTRAARTLGVERKSQALEFAATGSLVPVRPGAGARARPGRSSRCQTTAPASTTPRRRRVCRSRGCRWWSRAARGPRPWSRRSTSSSPAPGLERARNATGGAAPTAQPAAVEERRAEIWSTPQGFIKAALANEARVERKSGVSTRVVHRR